MKYKLTAVLLIIAIVSSSFSRFFVFAGYELNKNYIATKLCVNRNKPWLHCNGKCYLMKKIKQAEEKQAASDREAQKNLVQESFCETIPEIRFYTQLLQVIPIPNNHIDLPKGHNVIFRPPQIG
jgi:hypothetical protein